MSHRGKEAMGRNCGEGVVERLGCQRTPLKVKISWEKENKSKLH
jgi:hypothetical protein